MDLTKQHASDADSRAIHQVNFTAYLLYLFIFTYCICKCK